MSKYDTYYLRLAYAVRERAKCTGRTVGAVMVRDDRVVATGFNGTPAGMTNCPDGGCDRCAHPEQYPSGRDYDLCLCIHAEANCLLMAAKFGLAVEHATMYTTLQPCFICLKEMKQAGIARVVFSEQWTPPKHLIDEYTRLAYTFPVGVEWRETDSLYK